MAALSRIHANVKQAEGLASGVGQPNRVCMDFGVTWISGIHASMVHKLKQQLIGPNAASARVYEPYQMLAEVDAELRAALGVDVIGVWPRKNIFGYEANGWKPLTLFDGTPCLVQPIHSKSGNQN